MRRGLIVGYGRAGKRHAKMLHELGIDVYIYDPYIYSSILAEHWPETGIPNGVVLWGGIYPAGLENALQKHIFDFAVIATPPDLHLQQIRQCLDAGLPVLCEKPLCGLGQLEEAEALLNHPKADNVMVAYNYRFHPALIQARGKVPQWMTCYQDRELPEWGLLLDHCSHDLDILRFLCGEIDIQSAQYLPPGSFAHDTRRQMWEIMVKVNGLPEWQQSVVRLRESVGIYPERKAKLEYEDGGELDIGADPVMFRAMWESFLGGNYSPGLEDAIETQRLLEKCWRLASES